jgi:hypothetical protein
MSNYTKVVDGFALFKKELSQKQISIIDKFFNDANMGELTGQFEGDYDMSFCVESDKCQINIQAFSMWETCLVWQMESLLAFLKSLAPQGVEIKEFEAPIYLYSQSIGFVDEG